MALINTNRYGQPYRFGFQDGDGPTIGGITVRNAEIRQAPEMITDGANVEGHVVALAVTKPEKRKVLATFTGYVSDSFLPSDVPTMFNYSSRVFMVRDVTLPRRKGEFNEVTLEAESFFYIGSVTPSATTNDFNYFGSTAFLEDKGKLTTDIFGLQTCIARFKYPSSTAFSTLPSLFEAHPFYGWLRLERQEIDVTPGFLVITSGYAGIAGGVSESTPIYELCLGVGEEPIETHPKFQTDIAGTPSSPVHGAVFVDYETGKKTTDDEKGVFQEFLPIVGGSRNPFAGISSYLSPDQLTWRQRKVTTTRPASISDVGKIATPVGSPPSLGGGSRNWLLLAITYEQRGLVYFVTTEWRASGPTGWNSTIYGA